MSALLVTLHVIVALLLVGGILLQPGAKGGGLGASLGGGGGANSAFGARGAAPFLAKLTYWLAAGFMLTSLAIEVKIVKDNRSVLDKKSVQKLAPATTAPQAPAPAPTPAPASPSK